MNEINVYDANNELLTMLVQWDKEVYLYIYDSNITSSYDVHFCNKNSDSALVVSSTYTSGTFKVKVPNDLLTVALPIIGYIYVTSNGESRSIYCFKLMVRSRPQPSDYVYTGSDDYVAIVNVLAECKAYAASASDSSATAESYATLSKSYAVGGTNSRTGESTDNSRYYCEQAKTNASESQSAVTKVLALSVTTENYASNASDSSASAAESATKAQEYLDEIVEMQTAIEETIGNSLLSSSDDILASIEEYFARAEELYRSCMIVCDGEVPCRRVRTIVEIDCHTPQRRATGYLGVEFDGGTPAIRLLGE